MSNFWIQLLTTIGTLFGVAVTFYLGVMNLRKQNRNIIDKLEGVSVTVVGVSWDVKDMKFEREIIDVMRNETSKIISYSKSLEQIFKDSMVYINNHLQEIFLNYYFSSSRSGENNDKDDIEQQLVCEINAFKREWYSYLSNILPIKKTFKFDTGHKEQIDFSRFIKDSNLKDRLELLIVRLVENGYKNKPDKFKADVKSFINKFFDRYVALIMEWKSLDNDRVNS